jgi:hypothetical protein
MPDPTIKERHRRLMERDKLRGVIRTSVRIPKERLGELRALCARWRKKAMEVDV